MEVGHEIGVFLSGLTIFHLFLMIKGYVVTSSHIFISSHLGPFPLVCMAQLGHQPQGYRTYLSLQLHVPKVISEGHQDVCINEE